MATETQTTIQREAPEIEAYKIGLMEQAKGLTGRPPIGGLPDIRSAGMTPAQLQALQLQQGGVGSYQPYINAAQASYAAGLGTLGSTQPNALGMIASSVPMAAQGADQAGQSIGYGQQGANLSQAGADLTRSGLGYGQQGVGLSQTGADLTRSGIGYGQAGADLTRSGLGFGQQGVGIAQLGAQQYDPTSVSAYMNPYQSAISDEINRAYDIQQNQAAAQAVGAGAFGGSRGEIAAREVDRNRVSALAKAQADNYLQAQQAAMGAFEGQQGRQQNVGQLQQNLAQMAATAGGQLQNVGQMAATAGGQQQNVGQLQQNLAQMAAQAGSQQQQAGKQFADIGQFALQAGDARQKAAQIAQQAGSAYGGMGLSQAESLARLGRSQADLGAMQQGLQQQDISGLASLGEQQRNIRQQELEARRQTDMQNIYEPYQRLGFYSDILRGAPSTQSTLTVANTPNPSLLNQVVGGATAGLGIYGAANRGGLI
tara:strand:+ start:2953 stop:4404 length:1452 start_codon:yes stop_codon:yes gene_type:complete